MVSSVVPDATIVGLPDAAVEESRERVRFAICNAGFYFPRDKAAVNLAPAALCKEGPAYDLAIALGVLIATGQILPDGLERAIVLGELSMDGAVLRSS